jgi:hypothetical protein
MVGTVAGRAVEAAAVVALLSRLLSHVTWWSFALSLRVVFGTGSTWKP